MAGKDIKATAKLFLDTTNAANDAKQFFADLKKYMDNAESSMSKFGVFKELGAYISEVDNKLTALRNKNEDAFDHMFDGLDENLRSEMEGALGYVKDVIAEFNVLNDQINQVRGLKTELKSAMKVADQFNTDGMVDGMAKTEQEALDLLATFKELHNSINAPNVDKSSIQYYKDLIKYIKTASELAGTYYAYTNGDADFSIVNKLKKADFLNAGKVAETFAMNIDSKFGKNISKSLDGVISNIESKIANIQINTSKIKAPEFDDKDQLNYNKKLASSYDELKNKVRELVQAQAKFDSGLEVDDDGTNIEDKIDDLNEYFLALDKTGAKEKELSQILENLSFGDIDEDTALTQLCNTLQIEIPQAADMAAESVNQLNNAIGNTFSDASADSNVDENIKQIGDAAQHAESKIESLHNALQEVFMKASQHSVDVSNGIVAGKEHMNLFDATGLVSSTQGAGYQVDTSALVNQLMANLKQSIVMSLHDHPDNMDVFSPSDVKSFANLFYGQGTKIHGIIADGFIKTIDFSGITQEVAQKIALRYSENLQNMSKQYSNLFTFEDGTINLSEKMKNAQKDNPKQFSQLIGMINNAINEALNDAFVQNGVESTLKVFDVSTLQDLAKYLVEVQQSGQNALSPIEKLQNLLTTLHPDKEFNWDNYTDIFDKFSSGAIDGTQAMNQILNLDTVASQVGQAEDKLESFLNLSKDLQSRLDFKDVEIGQFLAQLDAAKNELQELANQGAITEEQMSEVFDAHKAATDHLDYRLGRNEQDREDELESFREEARTANMWADEYAGDAAVAEDKMRAAEIRANEAEIRADEALARAKEAEARASEAESRAKEAELDSLRHEESANRLLDEKFALQNENDELRSKTSKQESPVTEELKEQISLIDELKRKAAQYEDSQSFARKNIQDLKSIGVDNSKSARAFWRDANYSREDFQPVAMAMDDVADVIRNKVPENILDGWFRSADSSYKSKLENLALTDTDIRNAALNVMWDNYKQYSGKDIGFDEFLHSEIPVYRGKNKEKYVDGDELLSFTFDKSMAEKFGNHVYEAMIKPIDTIGAYQTTAESEVLVRRDQLEAMPGFSKWLENMTSGLDQSFVKAAEDVDSSDVINKENDALREQINLEKQVSNADQPKDTSDLQVINQENDALREQANLQDKINDSDATGSEASTKNRSKLTPEQKWDKNITVDGLRKYQGELRSAIKKLDFNPLDTNLTDQQQEIKNIYKSIEVEIEKAAKAVGKNEQVELSSIQETIAALREKIKVYKEQNNLTDSGKKKAEKSGKNYGSSVEIREAARYNKLHELALDPKSGYSSSKSFMDAFKEYEKSYLEFIAKKRTLESKDNVTKDDEVQFRQLSEACSKYARDLEKVVAASEKLEQSGSGKKYTLGKDFVNDDKGRKAALTDFAKQMHDVSSASLEFDKNFTKCMFSVKNSDGTFTKMTAQIDAYKNQIVETAGATKQTTSTIGSFFDDLKAKGRSIITYLISITGIEEVFQQIRQGFQYALEIDTALTELKKVTNETNAEYDAFLQTMSQTASVVGSTVSELTTMAAEWSRLGYSMEEAGKLAESTAILLNVSEFEDATTASEALISTMQAFQYTADESQHVVDILNEVGNNYAISSDGIATALQDSASALMEAGNNLEQSVALVAAANKVVQDPNSVGSALRTISLRLRGTSVKVLEEMGEETDGVVESVSKMQEKIEALTGVDILTDSGAYKDTYEILREIGQVWEDMSDIDQAECCLYVQKCA